MKSAQGRFAVACGLALLSAVLSSEAAAAPQLFGSAYNEGPVRGDQDDLLLLSGYPLAPGDTVVYKQVTDITRLPAPPSPVPSQNTADSGFADVVSTADLPYSLTVHLPSAMAPGGGTYILWVRDAGGNWSNGVLINDARPLWFTPDTIYQTAATAGLPRQLKVVGRNLQPAVPPPNGRTLVELVGPATYVMTAANTSNDSTTTAALERYVARVTLPASMVPGTYTVQVSRDGGTNWVPPGTNWVPLAANSPIAAQTLTVKLDPVAQAQFSVSDPKYGGCQPNSDVTSCLQSAIAAAYAANGGTVTLGAGTWKLNTAFCGKQGDGIVVLPGVSLQGAGAGSTTIERGLNFTPSCPTFSLQGGNTVQGITFHDDTGYMPGSDANGPIGPMLQIGVQWRNKNSYTAGIKQVSNVVITGNTFDKPFFAIGNGGLPMDHVFITKNVFGGAYKVAIYLTTDPYYASDPDSLQYPPQFGDSVVANNTFYPSSYVSTDLTQGPLASNIATGRRFDFSNNIADGTSTAYFYNSSDKKGWRATYFWSTGDSQEMTLVSQNNSICPGDKTGDGEAISYDGTIEWGGFVGPQPSGARPPGAGAVPVISAAAGSGSSSTVTLQGTLVTSSFPSGPITPDYYKGFWLQVVQGPGLGQWRKISAVSPNTSNGTVTFTVVPAFDVLPQSNSLAIVARGYWQNATVSNFVDQRQPLCTKANQHLLPDGSIAPNPSGGAISWFASTADSAMEGNEQHDTNGILLFHNYQIPGASSTPMNGGYFDGKIESSNEVRNNKIDGEYQWGLANSASGIQLVYGATSDSSAMPPVPVLGFGTIVAGNTINHADTAESRTKPLGALALGPNGKTGPPDANGAGNWKLADANLLFHNSLSDIAYSASDGLSRLGIGLDVADTGTSNPAPIAWRSVLFGNTCNTVSKPLLTDQGTSTVYYCPPATSAQSCECNGTAADLGAALASPPVLLVPGMSATYVVSIHNYGNSTATGGTLSAEPTPGIQITALNFPLGSCDLATRTCALGTIAPGTAVDAQVTVKAVATGTWPLLLSVTHQEADPNVSNNTLEVDIPVVQ